MDGNSLSLRLLSGVMPDDDATYNRRLGFWLRMARERAGKSQAGAAEFIGLSASSKSTVSDWENGARPPKLNQLRRLAAYYEVPLELFTDPEPTPEERIDSIVRLATDAERRDWASGLDRGQETDDGPDAGPGRLSA
jgi:transcriptional regulator with XRE-family HTH domain